MPSHICKSRFLAYMGADDDEDDESPPDSSTLEDGVISDDLSHIRALDSHTRAKAMTLEGTIASSKVTVLVDIGSTHDFLHPRVAERLHLPLIKIRPFRVYVGNGESILCSHVSKATELILQGKQFFVDLHILPVHELDVILGMEWLESLGRVTHDYVRKSMEFIKDDRRVVLQGVARPPKQISATALALFMTLTAGVELYEMVAIDDHADQRIAADRLVFPDTVPAQILEVLTANSVVFDIPVGLPPERPFDHRIHLTPRAKPINVRPYRYPYFQKNEIEKQVRDMLEQGVIQWSHSPFSLPVLLVRKKDGSFHFCIDYRALNKATIPDHFPIPTAEELFDELGAAKFFTKLDLRSGYHQIRMRQEDIFKTAFRTHDGHYEFLVMPFGLTNAPSTFQAAMNNIFRPLLRKSVIVLFDDILIYSPDLTSHGDHLRAVLGILAENGFFVKASKCAFCCTTVEYLGHLITGGCLKTAPGKIEAMVIWPVPSTPKQLRGFLGLTEYYRRFIAHYA